MVWNNIFMNGTMINAYFLFQTFERSYVDHNVYFKRA